LGWQLLPAMPSRARLSGCAGLRCVASDSRVAPSRRVVQHRFVEDCVKKRSVSVCCSGCPIWPYGRCQSLSHATSAPGSRGRA
jgi:hypothetical protein